METIVTKPQNSSITPKPATRRVKPTDPSADDMSLSQLRIKEAAYYKALERGFASGHELDDWLAAEKEENQ